MVWQLTFSLLLQVTPHLSSYDATALTMFKPSKHQILADPCCSPVLQLVTIAFSVL